MLEVWTGCTEASLALIWMNNTFLILPILGAIKTLIWWVPNSIHKYWTNFGEIPHEPIDIMTVLNLQIAFEGLRVDLEKKELDKHVKDNVTLCNT